jgi:hypothetical protein
VCTRLHAQVTAYYCGSAVADNLDVDKIDPHTAMYGLHHFELMLDSIEDSVPTTRKGGGKRQHEEVDHILRRAVFRFGLESGEAGIDHVWMIVQNADHSFLWLQSYIGEYSLGTFMDLSRKAGFNPMSISELRRRVALLKILEQKKDAWDQETDDAYFELFNVRVNDRKERQSARHYTRWDKKTWKGGRVTLDLACNWPRDKAAHRKKKSRARARGKGSATGGAGTAGAESAHREEREM